MYEVDWESDWEASRAAVLRGTHDLYLIHWELHGQQGAELVSRCRNAGSMAPLVLVTQHADPDQEARAIRSGADAVLVGDELTPPTLDRTLRHAFERAHHQRGSMRPPSPKQLPDSSQLLDHVEIAINQAKRTNVNSAVLCVNLAGLVEALDQEGPAAHQLELAIAERLSACVREGDTLARWSANEFCILLATLDHAQGAVQVADRAISALETPFTLNGEEYRLLARVGVSLYPEHADTPMMLVESARQAARAAHSDGPSVLFHKRTQSAIVSRRAAMARCLRGAVDRGEMSLHYQPQIDLRDGRLVGVESLLRWNSGELGQISPVEFVPVLEETGLIESVGEWSIRTAIHQAKAWYDSGLPIRVAVNASARQFRSDRLGKTIRGALEETGLSPSLLELEITEGLLLENTAETRTLLDGLRREGVKVAVDDFGTGYASLSYIKQFPMDIIKIDREFVRNLPLDVENAAITSAILALARSLGLEVIAEGVENEAELEFLKDQRCHVVQGFLHARPMPADKLSEWVEARVGVRPKNTDRPGPGGKGKWNAA